MTPPDRKAMEPFPSSARAHRAEDVLVRQLANLGQILELVNAGNPAVRIAIEAFAGPCAPVAAACHALILRQAELMQELEALALAGGFAPPAGQPTGDRSVPQSGYGSLSDRIGPTVGPGADLRNRIHGLVGLARVLADDPERSLTARQEGVLRSLMAGMEGLLGQVEGPTAPPPAALRGRQVLVVDRDLRSLFMAAGLLEGQGLQVSCATSASEALERLARTPAIELVLVDLPVVEPEGEDARALRALMAGTAVPKVAFSATAGAQDPAPYLAAGCADLIVKPVDGDRLITLVHRCLVEGDRA